MASTQARNNHHGGRMRKGVSTGSKKSVDETHRRNDSAAFTASGSPPGRTRRSNGVSSPSSSRTESQRPVSVTSEGPNIADQPGDHGKAGNGSPSAKEGTAGEQASFSGVPKLLFLVKAADRARRKLATEHKSLSSQSISLHERREDVRNHLRWIDESARNLLDFLQADQPLNHQKVLHHRKTLVKDLENLVLANKSVADEEARIRRLFWQCAQTVENELGPSVSELAKMLNSGSTSPIVEEPMSGPEEASEPSDEPDISDPLLRTLRDCKGDIAYLEERLTDIHLEYEEELCNRQFQSDQGLPHDISEADFLDQHQRSVKETQVELDDGLRAYAAVRKQCLLAGLEIEEAEYPILEMSETEATMPEQYDGGPSDNKSAGHRSSFARQHPRTQTLQDSLAMNTNATPDREERIVRWASTVTTTADEPDV